MWTLTYSALPCRPREDVVHSVVSLSMFKHERIWNLRQLDDAVCTENVNFTCWNFLIHIHESSAFLFALLLPPPLELYCEFFNTALCISSPTIWERFSIFLMKYSARRENIFSYSVDSWNIKNHQISLASVAEYEKFALESSTCCCYNIIICIFQLPELVELLTFLFVCFQRLCSAAVRWKNNKQK